MIKIVISDSGPLISLANAKALDLLLNFEPGVEVVVTDIVYLETTSGRDVHKDAEKYTNSFPKIPVILLFRVLDTASFYSTR
jgi:hypothetical protein